MRSKKGKKLHVFILFDFSENRVISVYSTAASAAVGEERYLKNHCKDEMGILKFTVKGIEHFGSCNSYNYLVVKNSSNTEY